MYYILPAAVILIAALIFYRLFSDASEPDFELQPLQSDEQLALNVLRLAQNSQDYRANGNGLSLRLIKKTAKKCYVALKNSPQQGLFDFQIRLLDNFHVLMSTLARLKKSIKKCRSLAHTQGLPRLYRLCQLIVKSGGGAINPAALKQLIDKYNAISPLNYDEIQALPTLLFYALSEFLCIYCAKAAVVAKSRKSALVDVKKGRLNLNNLNKSSYLYFFAEHALGGLSTSFNALCEKNDISIESKTQGFIHLVADYNGAVENGLFSLNSLDAVLTDEYLSSVSPLNALLRGESVVFDQCTQPTKNVYLHHIARLAKRRHKKELFFARTLIESAQRENVDIAAKILPKAGGYGLMRLYIAVVVLLSVALSSLPLFFCARLAVAVALSVLMLPSSLAIVLGIAGEINARHAFRRYLPRIKIPDCAGDGEQLPSTLLTYCGLVGSKNDIDELFFSMQTARYANPHPMFCYALLLDLPSGKEVEEGDSSLLDHCKKCFDQLDEPRFAVFVRKRKKIEGQEKFQGWEKKRGALLQLNEYLLEGNSEAFALVLGSCHKNTKYVITLDSDTMLNCAHELVEIMEHPFNSRKCVVSLSAKINPYCLTTLFGRFNESELGISGYSQGASDINYDLFDSGNYTGKGIYRLKEFNERLRDFFPDNRLLSHDFIEGAVGGCGSAERAVEGCPTSFAQSLGRSLRWLRGDWQLLPYLLRRVKNRSCKKCENPITPIDKWHIFCNLVFSLLPIFMVASAAICAFEPRIYFGLIFAFCYVIFGILNSIRSAVLHKKLPFLQWLRAVFYVGMLPISGFYYLAAICVTLVRLATKRRLLEWKIFKGSAQKISPLPTIFCVIGFATAAALVSPIFYFFAGIFAVMPIVARLLNCAYKEPNSGLAEFKGQLLQIAGQTWAYFNAIDRSALVPDNLQLHLNKGFANRTSPTNIGFDILSVFCAFKLNFINKEESVQRLQKIISQLEAQQKWHGNFYNWVDLSGNILHPKYISTVDNGNLLACLLVVVEHDQMLKPRIKKLIDDMDLLRLYDKKRGLLHIGFNQSEMSFEGHYDLLASEAMLTYLVAIGTGKIPKNAFFNLNRIGLRARAGVVLASWGGGLFEYLMNCIFLRYPRFGMLRRSAQNVIKSHKRAARGQFWGISESQYNRVDSEGNYQYRSFGEPSSGLSEWTCGSVTAPYASLLALNICPKSVQKNIARIKKSDMMGDYGFFESMDNGLPIKTYMTHHQGMILASICNFLCDNAIIKQLESLPQIAAVGLLLTQNGFEAVAKKPVRMAATFNQESQCVAAVPTTPQRLNFLTNGSYHLIHTAAGGSHSLLGKIGISRNESDFRGLRIFAAVDGMAYCDTATGASFDSFKTTFDFKNELIKITQTSIVLPDFDGEMRRLDIKNLTNRPLKVQLISYFEPSLCPQIDDLSHKIFSSMKIRTQIKDNMLIASRTGVDSLFLAHFLSVPCQFESNLHNLCTQNEVTLPHCGSPIYPVLSAKTVVALKPLEKTELSAFFVTAPNLDTLAKIKKIVLSAGYFRQSVAASCAYSRHLGLSRRICDIGSVLKSAPFADLPPLAPLPTLLFEHKQGTQRLCQLLRQLQPLQRFFDFNVVVCYAESDGYFKKVGTALSLLDDGRLKNLHFFDYAQRGEAIEQIRRTAIDISLPINFENLPAKTSDLPFDVINFAAKQAILPPLKKTPLPLPPLDLDLNGKGFLSDSSFVILPKFNPLRPWCNVIGTRGFGTIISHNGGGYTYSKNSQTLKITELSNDPIFDRASEGVLFFEGGLGWAACRNPIKNDADYYVRHSFGFSEFKSSFNGTIATLTQHCGLNGGKFYVAHIKNMVDKRRKIETVFFLNLVLGDMRERTHGFIRINFCQSRNCVEAVNVQNGQRVGVFCSHKISKCIINGSGNHLAQLNDILISPSCAVCVNLQIEPNCSAEVVFKLADLSSCNLQENLTAQAEKDYALQQNLTAQAEKSCAEAHAYFKGLSCVEVVTPDKPLNHLLKWLPYQVLSSRFNARAGFYQAGGAIGFRDQLQDCFALLYVNPEKVRSHILLCAAHQFLEGDVQHWWHPPYNGVRTRITDDLLYLPLLTAEYVAFTGDKSILSVSVPYLSGRELALGERDAYFKATPADSEPLFNHCLRALFFNTINEQGLVLMGGGDWNDAMDNVGARGKGASVFNTIFLFHVINKFLPLVEQADLRAQLAKRAERLRFGANNAWDGEWFLRAISDDGLIIGSKKSNECKIDLLCQSWAALSGIADQRRTKTALKSAAERLIDFNSGTIKLLDPPFEAIDAGYISKYPKGIRENGGQYTHAAVWYIMALLGDGQADFACSLLDMLNPIKRHQISKKYLAEPYVLCGDVYGGDYAGVSGWSWYTGAAAWYYKCVVENVLGITKRADKLYFSPNLPFDAGVIRVRYRTQHGELSITIDNTKKEGTFCIYVGRIKYNTNFLQITSSLLGKEIEVRRE